MVRFVALFNTGEDLEEKNIHHNIIRNPILLLLFTFISIILRRNPIQIIETEI